MAKEKTEEEQTEESAPKEKKSSNMLLIIIIVVLILIIIIGAVAALLLMGGDEAPTNQSAPQVQEKKVAKQTTHKSANGDNFNSTKLDQIGTLYPLDTFTVNLKSDSGSRYLKVTLSLELSAPELSKELDAKTPVLRDRIIRILSSKTLEEISSKKGKQKVSDQIVDTLNSMLTDGEVKNVYFTEFVIQ